MPGYWHAHSDRDFEDGLFDPPEELTEAEEAALADEIKHNGLYAAGVQLEKALESRIGPARSLAIGWAKVALLEAGCPELAEEAEMASVDLMGSTYRIGVLLEKIEPMLIRLTPNGARC